MVEAEGIREGGQATAAEDMEWRMAEADRKELLMLAHIKTAKK